MQRSVRYSVTRTARAVYRLCSYSGKKPFVTHQPANWIEQAFIIIFIAKAVGVKYRAIMIRARSLN